MVTRSFALLMLGLPLAALSTPASAQIPCAAKGQQAFFATYGDNTQRYDGAGSVDDPTAALYAMPPQLLANAAQWWGNGVVGTDVAMADAARPGVLQGYTPFDYEQVDNAFLRFDLYYTQYSNTEGLGILEENTFSGNIFVFSYYDDLRVALAKADNDRPQWVSVRLDLITGNAFAWQIDDFGNPIRDYGQFTTWGNHPWDVGELYYVLKSAADGDLYPMLYDDMALSYMALYGITRGESEECH